MRNNLKFLLALISVFFATNAIAQYKGQAEVSSVVTGGNTDLKTYYLKSENSYTKTKNTFKLIGTYTNGESNDIRSVEKWDILGRYERAFKPKLSGFLSELVESDRFAGFRRRFNTDIGLKHTFIKNEKNTSFVEGGYRYTKEKNVIRTTADKDASKGRVYLETKHKFSGTVSARLWVEYLPNFTDTDDYILKAEPSLSVVISSVFSLKTAYNWTYDNEPLDGNKRQDYTYTTALVANFE